MQETDRQSGEEHGCDAAPEGPDSAPAEKPAPTPNFDESLVDEAAALIDDARTYAQAELVFQKTRAKLTGRSIGFALGYVVVAVVLLHIAFLALAVGLVIALEPLVTIWGAIAIVVGALLLLTGLLLYGAVKQGRTLGILFSSAETEDAP